MKEIFLTHNRSWTVREVVAVVILLIIVTVGLIWLYRKKRIVLSQVIASELLFAFLAIVLASTVFTRTPNGVHNYELLLFWSWIEVIADDRLMLEEILLNMILLAPAGFLLPFVFNKRIVWYKAFLMGVGFSALIEVSQLLLCRGLFEWDDILHNALGAMAGCGVAERLFGRFQ